VNLHPSSRINEERVRELFQAKVDNLAEKRVDFYIDTRNSLEVTEHKDWQTL